MLFEVPGRSGGRLVHREGEHGYIYDDWHLTEASRAKMLAKWPELDLPWIDIAAKKYASTRNAEGSARNGFVDWRDDVEDVSAASAKLLKVLHRCAPPARHSLGASKSSVSLYDFSVAIVSALKEQADILAASAAGVDARKLSHPLPTLISTLARQLRYAGQSELKFRSALVSLTTMTLDGLELRHTIDIRSAVRDALKSGG